MDAERFAEMVARLERESSAAPGAYRFKVALLALLGFGVLALVLGFAGLGLLLLVGVAAAVLLSGGKALILLFKLGKFLVLLAVPLWMLVKSSLSALFTRFPAPDQGREIRRAEAPALFAALDAMRARMKGPRFHHVRITNDFNAAVMQRPLLGLFGWPRNYLLLGLPLLESLSAEEALSVVAHEYGHLAGSHAHFGAFIYRLRHTWGTIQDLAGQWQGWGGRLLRRIVEWYAPYFNAYTFVLARANEYEADAASAELVGQAVAASALKRVNIVGVRYQQFFDGVFRGLRDVPQPPADTAERWSRDAVQMPPAELATRWLQDSLGREKNAFDTHPVLRERLRALPDEAQRVEALPAPLAGPSAAQAWLGASAAALRDLLQSEWARQVEPSWRERHATLQQQLARLTELRALEAPDVAQSIERLRLQAMLEPERDHLPEVAAFNAATPDQAPTVYLEGSLRLDRDDESGLALLERAMQLDGDAIKPGCERAHAFLVRRGAEGQERARAYAQRWQERHAWELTREQQLRNFDRRHELRAPDELSEAAWRSVRNLVEANSKGIARAWLARRVLPADPQVATYVLCVQLTRWARFRSKGPQIVDRLAGLEWPMHAFMVSLEGENKSLRRVVKALPASATVFPPPR